MALVRLSNCEILDPILLAKNPWSQQISKTPCTLLSIKMLHVVGKG